MKYVNTLLLFVFTIFITSAEVRLGFDGEEAASVSIYVSEISSGKVVAENDAARALVPASILKSLTAATALSTVGADFQYITPVYLYGKEQGSTWNGNLVIESCGDPSIDSTILEHQPKLADEIVKALTRMGITMITGRILIDESLEDAGVPPTWEIEDVAWSYGAGLYGFNFRDNTFNLWPATGKTQPYVPNLEIIVTDENCSTDLLRGVNSNTLFVTGHAPARGTWRVTSAMQDPASIFAVMLKDQLETAGIEVLDKDIDDISTRRLVFEHRSPKFADLLQAMMYESQNMYAEAALRSLAPEGNRGDALDVESKLWASRGVSLKNTMIRDGSGLSRSNRISAHTMSDMLAYMAKSDIADTYIGLFPHVGVNGTVKPLLKDSPLKDKLALKSGSMSSVHCYAGYKLDAAGKPTHTVVIMVNGFFCPRAQVRTAIEKFLTQTFCN